MTAVRYELVDGIVTLTLSRPDRLNALNEEAAEELMAALNRIDADDAVRAVIVTGDGRAFCAGADISGGASTFDQGEVDPASEEARDWGGRLTLRIFRLLKPIIAAINGAAVGVGVTMTLAMDVRLASEAARFGFVFTKRGIVPEAASTFFLPRIVGISQALEWCYRGDLVPADAALRAGLVRSVHSPAELMPAALEIAHAIARESAPVSVALTRQMLWHGLGMRHPMEAHRVDSRLVHARGRSADAAEGVTAFLERRPPIFPDRVSTELPDMSCLGEEPSYS